MLLGKQLNMEVRKYFETGTIASLLGAFCMAISCAEETASPPKPQAVTHVDAKQAQQLISQKKVVVLDLRTPKEYEAGHIGGATNIDFLASDFEDRLKELDKGKAYLIHCAVGGRSSHSLATFKRQQFSSIYHLDGGIKAWENANLPLER